jgi:hypothetical protein
MFREAVTLVIWNKVHPMSLTEPALPALPGAPTSTMNSPGWNMAKLAGKKGAIA